MKSMTGCGRGECVQDGFKVAVEVQSINRKQADIQVDLPRDLEVLESAVRNTIHQVVSRGRLTVKVLLQAPTGRKSARMHLNRALAKAYTRELRALAKELKLEDTVSLDHLIRAPGVFQTDEQLVQAEDFWPAIEKALQQALTALLKMRSREGAHLAKDLAGRIRTMQQAAARVHQRAPMVAEHHRRQLIERARSAGVEMGVDDDRLLKEIVIFADRSDISEELTRLESHFRQFDSLAKSREPVGRTLDFLAQEMNREINTIGSKANDGEISHAVVTLKTELEKFREQAQNVE
ncbi:MAG: YicC family protein [Verrucomicrobia bacterium]|jgi:uncharacterized protein (TIGR00255 family)|nr:YicC family protein [Verrucomicrobiota bacterium]